MAIGIPPGRPVHCAMLSITDVRGWSEEKVIRRPIPADSKSSGIGGGEGRIVLRVCGIGEADLATDEGGTGYVGREYFSEVLFSIV